MDLLNVSGEMDFKGWRCLNCGDITDPVIVSHHQLAASASAKFGAALVGVPLMHSGS